MRIPPQFQQLFKEMQKIQKKLEETQKQLEEKTITVQVGGGMVTVTANGKQEIISIQIEDELINPEEKEMLEDLIIAGVNEALKRAKEMVEEEIAKITGGLKFPGLNLPGIF
ncbi:MAG: DNA-binding nucleoid-associated protein YbaB/EfbC [Thermodesulfobacterium sp.]|uniref:Nucleoid-associated protein OD816_000583 n=1 Tax=Candidatus Thermodesulfobacterium syntrophicum TaxID=3060442 RepID=A0AAE3TFQ0_9BACT|nr:DNA-binding nucleoid-associated protein YbaB/EfbC [Candidatus Thermodesulfobacterium syntrophicum]